MKFANCDLLFYFIKQYKDEYLWHVFAILKIIFIIFIYLFIYVLFIFSTINVYHIKHVIPVCQVIVLVPVHWSWATVTALTTNCKTYGPLLPGMPS